MTVYQFAHGGIPERSLPTFGWPLRSIPGIQGQREAGIVALRVDLAGNIVVETVEAGSVELVTDLAGDVGATVS